MHHLHMKGSSHWFSLLGHMWVLSLSRGDTRNISHKLFFSLEEEHKNAKECCSVTSWRAQDC